MNQNMGHYVTTLTASWNDVRRYSWTDVWNLLFSRGKKKYKFMSMGVMEDTTPTLLLFSFRFVYWIIVIQHVSVERRIRTDIAYIWRLSLCICTHPVLISNWHCIHVKFAATSESAPDINLCDQLNLNKFVLTYIYVYSGGFVWT